MARDVSEIREQFSGILGFPFQTPKKIDTSSTTSTTATTITLYAEKKKGIITIDQYARRLGLAAMRPNIKAMVQRYLDAGMEVEVVMHALEDTSLAPRPSWRYCLAILRRCVAESAVTEDAWQRRQMDYQQAQAERRRQKAEQENAQKQRGGWNDYPQHSYTKEEYEAMYDDIDALFAAETDGATAPAEGQGKEEGHDNGQGGRP